MSKKSKNAIKNDQMVSAYHYGDTVEMSTSLGSQPIMRKVNKDMMVNRVTGEIKDINHVQSRADPRNYESLRSTFKKLKRLIGANFFWWSVRALDYTDLSRQPHDRQQAPLWWL